ncbi:hypothetical protein FB45DRAFT_904269 [Roridomyces roridus]|uniref:CID domain-containing protein n=1 Tax=Roridomyces roridus TaxID=1738132 RepID=A0AAD7C4K0_9AGAR|nr:hypothetical protein FB45DRAFT_904269 [Roridomyces roridus]
MYQQTQYPYYPPQPQPVYLPDPATFRRDYAKHLAELTVNSRPIIQNLSMIAQEYARFADIVAQCLEQHIRRVPQWMKLPAFYLLDAISKNVFDPYARQFSAFVVPLFLETYHQVDQSTRSKMEEMLITWRTGSPTNTDLFGPDAQRAIERGVWGDPNNNYSNQITKTQVLTELEFTLNQKERAVQTNVYDTTSQNHINVLHQLRKLVEAGVSQEELQQILNQLRSLVRAAVPPPPPPPPPQPQWTPPPTNYATPPPPVPPANNIFNILSTLKKSGILEKVGVPEQVGVPEPPDLERESSRTYRDAILRHSVKLTSVDITRKRPDIVEFLYDRLQAQCKQWRIHLDMHFQQNRKANNQTAGRGHARSWFVSVDDWVHDTASADLKGKGRERPVNPNSKAAAAAETAKRDADLRGKYVVVPPGDESKTVSCPVCKEVFESEWNEEDEDWVWRNAVRVDERIYHATCHAEAQSGLALRLRSELASLRSHSNTPEGRGVVSSVVTPPGRQNKLGSGADAARTSLSPSPTNGKKRKVEDTDDTVSVEAEGTPRLKKMMLEGTVS